MTSYMGVNDRGAFGLSSTDFNSYNSLLLEQRRIEKELRDLCIADGDL